MRVNEKTDAFRGVVGGGAYSIATLMGEVSICDGDLDHNSYDYFAFHSGSGKEKVGLK